jgi:hypothetical protein
MALILSEDKQYTQNSSKSQVQLLIIIIDIEKPEVLKKAGKMYEGIMYPEVWKLYMIQP